MSYRNPMSRLASTKDRIRDKFALVKVAVIGAPVIYLLFFFVSALVVMFVISFWQSQQYTLVPDSTIKNYVYILTASSYQTLIVRSLIVALATTGFSLIIGYPIAYYIARGVEEHQLPILLLFAAPFFVGTMLRESAHQAIVGPNGLANQLLIAIGIGPLEIFNYGLFQVFLGELYLWAPFMMISIYLSLDLIDFTLLESAIDGGATPFKAFREVTWPLSLPGVTVGSVLVFVSTLVSAIPSRFVGGPDGSMIGNSVKGLFNASGAWATGAALGSVLIVISVLFVGLILAYTLRKNPNLGLGDSQ